MTADEDRDDTAELTEELSALEASARAWASFKFLRDGTDNVVRMTDAEKYDLSRLLGEIR